MDDIANRYDIVLSNEKIVPVANESFIVKINQEFKNDIEKSGSKEAIIRCICFMNENSIPVGLKFHGFINGFYKTEVFCYNPIKAMFSK